MKFTTKGTKEFIGPSFVYLCVLCGKRFFHYREHHALCGSRAILDKMPEIVDL